MSQIETRFSLVVAERTRIARELHDTLIQGFAGITMQLQALSEELPSAERESLSDIISDAGNCLRETRQSVAGLRDEEQSSPGLKKAIVEAAGRISHGNMRIQFDLEESQHELAPGTKYNLLLILQEAVLNAVRHSGADLVEVSLRNMDDGELVLSVSDHGRGAGQSSGDDKQGHFGIVGMRERANDMGAEFEWNSIPGVGTTVRVQLPTKKSTPLLHKLSQVRTNL
jgi:signal transduction histidine kinase